ncbi:MAG: arginase family protein [Acidobacteriia bacterium]|nr:arginase family protein [Terriglobia bacterium]
MLKIRILGVPLDLGQERRGVDMGPSAVRAAGLNSALKSLGHQVEDAGDIHVKIPEMQHFGDRRAKYLNEIAETSQEVAHRVYQALEGGYFPLSLGGDHSVAIGTQAGVAKFFRDRDQAVGCIWLDAHADMNTPETSPSGNVHGMPFATTLGLGPDSLSKIFGFSPKIKPDKCVLIGARDLDSRERRMVRDSGINVFTMRTIDELGMRAVMEKALALATTDTAGFVVSFDMDVVMTSEREWGCYPQVPGLAICQLARQDGVDAVLVTPWRWDGRERRPAERAAA